MRRCALLSVTVRAHDDRRVATAGVPGAPGAAYQATNGAAIRQRLIMPAVSAGAPSNRAGTAWRSPSSRSPRHAAVEAKAPRDDHGIARSHQDAGRVQPADPAKDGSYS
jgi:hypothetical protein